MAARLVEPVTVSLSVSDYFEMLGFSERIHKHFVELVAYDFGPFFFRPSHPFGHEGTISAQFLAARLACDDGSIGTNVVCRFEVSTAGTFEIDGDCDHDSDLSTGAVGLTRH